VNTIDSSTQSKTVFDGNILLFYAFDVGDDIALKAIEERGLVPTHVVPLSSYFKNYHLPLSFYLTDTKEKQGSTTTPTSDCIISKIHHFGVLSFCYRIPFTSTLEELKSELLEIKEVFDKRSEVDAEWVFKRIKSKVVSPKFYNLKTFYFAIHVNPTADKMEPLEFKEKYGTKIASLLRLETKNLSDYQMDEILTSSIGYYGQDLVIIDSEAAFIYDHEYFEQMEFFESANVQQLELQYFDRLLDEELNQFYKQRQISIPLSVYIPFINRNIETPTSRLARLRVDISVITERLENSIKLVGDSYYSRIYSILTEKRSLKEWRDSISRKLKIAQDLYQVHQDRLDLIHEEFLELIIIILIATEIILSFMKR